MGKLFAAVLALVLVLASSSPARACLFTLANFNTGAFSFEGRAVPRNAQLRIFAADARDTLQLERPDGATVDVFVGSDALGRVVVLDGLLAPGPHAIIAAATESDPERRVEFVVDDVISEGEPDVVDAHARHHTNGALLFPNSCEDQWPSDFVDIVADDRDDLAFVVVDGGALGRRLPNGNFGVTLREDRGGTVSYDVVGVDFAGNESDVVTVSAWSGCEGGCASSSSLPLAATLLLLLRRRR